jgi:preprotein translocase subunit SecF
MSKDLKETLAASLIFFILILFAFPSLSLMQSIALSLIFGLFGQTLSSIERYLKNINDKLRKNGGQI